MLGINLCEAGLLERPGLMWKLSCVFVFVASGQGPWLAMVVRLQQAQHDDKDALGPARKNRKYICQHCRSNLLFTNGLGEVCLPLMRKLLQQLWAQHWQHSQRFDISL